METTSRLRRPALALALALALGAALAHAPEAGARPPRGPGPAAFLARHAERLGLDASAQARIGEIAAESEARDEALETEIREARGRLRALLSAAEIDRGAILAQADALEALHARAHRNRLEAMLAIHELLTPAQREALVAIRKEERPWRRGRGPLGRCSADLRALCAAAPEGPGALRCLADRWEELSEPCREAVASCRDHEPPPGGPDASEDH